ncbi:MAG: hypothetical protein ACM3NF_08000 [Gemmatimonadota bacterium]
MSHFRAAVSLALVATISLLSESAISGAFAEQAEQEPAQRLQAQEVQRRQTGIASAMDNGAAPAAQKTSTLPAKALISGVPFISWKDAAKLKYGEKEILNPSWAASYGMVLEYWGGSRTMLESSEQIAMSGFEIVSSRESGKAWGVDDLKGSVARGIPVMVTLPVTPDAHPLYLTFEMMIVFGQVKNVDLKDQGRPRSNALGRMVSLEDLTNIKEQAKMNPALESTIMAGRLVIGYDDSRKSFIVHDPSFGPAFEIRYEDFEKMWALTDGSYLVVSPKDFPERTPATLAGTAYRPRASDEQAAMHFVYGYALDCIGRLAASAKHFEQGLAIPGVSKGYQFLFQFEMALNRAEQGDFAGAVAAAEKATEVLPEHPAAWAFLSQAYMVYPEGGDRERARKAEKNAKAMGEDKRARKVVATTIPADFFVTYLGPIRGWGGEAITN